MKKLLATLFIALFVLAGCQESATIVSPDNDAALEKETENVLEKEANSVDSKDNQDPGYPRI